MQLLTSVRNVLVTNDKRQWHNAQGVNVKGIYKCLTQSIVKYALFGHLL